MADSTNGRTDPRWSLFGTDPFPILLGDGLVAGSGGVGELVAPHNRQVVGRFSVPDAGQIEQAVTAARAAVDGGAWSRLTGRDRGDLLRRLAELVEKHADELAFLEAVDGGKAISGVRSNDIAVSLEALDYFASRASFRAGAAVDTGDPVVHHRSRWEPVGVVLEILPWNGPLWTGVQRMAAILAGGNAAILKPAELSSASFLRLAQLITQVGFPPGAVQVLPGPGRVVGEALVTHPGVDLVSLTGGVQTGAHILGLTAASIKRTVLELGGKNPNLVFADADLPSAAMWSAIGGFSNSGQICASGSRILVQRPVYDEFLAAFVAHAESFVVGDPLDPDTQLGPVNGANQWDKIWEYVEIGREQATVLTGGVRYDDPVRRDGWYIPPTVLADVAPNCPAAVDEIFGPVVTVTPFDDTAEAIRLANDSRYGLTAGVFTSSLATAGTVTDSLAAGQVFVNQWFGTGGVAIGSQGYKQSGLGGVGMEKYLQQKNVFTRLT
ncbi:aldehyde dehydrogenase family protein [Micromonospora sp. NPDC049048]|uniref:aldehyde dehydrogenase family protein n=1 Tax=Micromonospora sp. NPDC049048 TaxID=3364263 RepID=UPI00371BA1D0